MVSPCLDDCSGLIRFGDTKLSLGAKVDVCLAAPTAGRTFPSSTHALRRAGFTEGHEAIARHADSYAKGFSITPEEVW